MLQLAKISTKLFWYKNNISTEIESLLGENDFLRLSASKNDMAYSYQFIGPWEI